MMKELVRHFVAQVDTSVDATHDPFHPLSDSYQTTLTQRGGGGWGASIILQAAVDQVLDHIRLFPSHFVNQCFFVSTKPL